METGQRETLFSRTYPDVRLTNPPIVRVIGQLRFGALSVLQAGDQAAQSFIGALADRYPYSEQGADTVIQFSIGQPIQQSHVGRVWRLRSADQRTSVALTDGSIALETTDYKGREAFCAELKDIATALVAATKLPAFTRLGVRYTNRLTGFGADQLQNMIHPELLGVVGAADSTNAQMLYSLSQGLFAFEPGAQRLLAQWGSMPAGASIDPSLAPISEPSWLLDMDAFIEYPDASAALLLDQVGKTAEACAEHAHTFFRWAVTDAYLQEFGAQL
ncbi:TIGR04255 family protein [Streptacidiphilus neutrinimicus]|uniref:TIGR04255 family protein n=1 Tax=Streptacidiphilus neutrinimicus TaxID=105420 RepID=UPI0005A9161D|nr:TIGR04255 family protein [Streptacidiphilus neutrinimicus]